MCSGQVGTRATVAGGCGHEKTNKRIAQKRGGAVPIKINDEHNQCITVLFTVQAPPLSYDVQSGHDWSNRLASLIGSIRNNLSPW